MAALRAKKYTNHPTLERRILNEYPKSKKLEDMSHYSDPIVRYDATQTFYSIPWDILETLLDKPHHCHEVITYKHPIHLFFDVDEIFEYPFKSKETGALMSDECFLEEYLTSLQNCIEEVFLSVQDELNTINQTPVGNLASPIIMTGSRLKTNAAFKVSLHIIYPNTIIYARDVLAKLYHHLTITSAFSFDNVYQQNKNFRMVNGIKDGYLMTLSSGGDGNLCNTLVQIRSTWNITLTLEAEMMDYDYDDHEIINAQHYITQAIKLFESIHKIEFDQYSFSVDDYWKGKSHLRRISSGWCVLCERMHDSENASLTFYKIQDSLECTFICYRNQTKRASIALSKENKSNKVDIEGELDRVREKSPSDIAASTDWHIPGAHVVSDFSSFIYSPNKIVVFRGPTGCGKTYAIHHYLKDVLKEEDVACVIVSSRIAYSYQLTSRFADLDPANYKEETGIISSKCIIIQVDSLSRLDLEFYKKKRTIVILDEINSIMAHSNGLPPRRSCDVMDTLYILLDMCHRIIISDAYLQREHLMPLLNCVTNDMVVGISPDLPWSHSTIKVHENTASFMDALLDFEPDDKVAVTSITLKGLSGIQKIVFDKYPDLKERSITFTSETPRIILKEAFMDITKAIDSRHWIFYTQTLGSGNDINLDMPMFVYVDNRSNHMTPHEVLQQLNRVRGRYPTHVHIKAYHQPESTLTYEKHLESYSNRIVFPFRDQQLHAFRLNLKSKFKVEWKVGHEVILSKSARNFPRSFFNACLLYGEEIRSYHDGPSDDDIIDAFGKSERDQRLREIAEAIKRMDDEDHGIQHYIQLYQKICGIYKVPSIEVESYSTYASPFTIRAFRNLEILFAFTPPTVDEQDLNDALSSLCERRQDKYLLADAQSHAKRSALLLMVEGLGFKHVLDSDTNKNLPDLNDELESTLRTGVGIYLLTSNRTRKTFDKTALIRLAVKLLRSHGVIVSKKHKRLSLCSKFSYKVEFGSDEYEHYVNLMCENKSERLNQPVITIPKQFLDLVFKDNSSEYKSTLNHIRNYFLYIFVQNARL